MQEEIGKTAGVIWVALSARDNVGLLSPSVDRVSLQKVPVRTEQLSDRTIFVPPAENSG
jgi:hypothetical protein